MVSQILNLTSSTSERNMDGSGAIYMLHAWEVMNSQNFLKFQVLP